MSMLLVLSNPTLANTKRLGNLPEVKSNNRAEQLLERSRYIVSLVYLFVN